MKKAIRHFIIEKARDIFQLKGYTNTTIEDLAQEADISKPTLYKYFNGKDDIFRAVVDLSNDEYDAMLAPLFDSPDPFPEKLKKLTYSILNQVNKNRGILKIAFHESHMFIEAIDKNDFGGIDRFLKAIEKRVKFYKIIFQEGMESGYIDKNVPLDLIPIFYSGILGEFSLAYILGKERMADLNLHQLTDHITRIMSRGIMNDKKRHDF